MTFHAMRRCTICGRRLPVDGPSRCGSHRPSAAARGYDSRWRGYTARFLREFPRCGDRPPEAAPCTEHSTCAAAGRPVPATVVDHITPHRGDPVLFWSRSNHQALCKPCHDRKTGSEDTPHATPGSPR